MIIEKLVGNIHEDGSGLLDGRHHEKVVLPSADLVKRIQRVSTDHGRELGLRLAPGPDLRDGDILLITDSELITVSVLPTDVLVIAPESIFDMGFIAHSLGNRHLQAQFFDRKSEYGAEVMVVQYDHTVEDFLKHHHARYERQERIMPVPFRHAEHTH
ncbi:MULTISPECIES: urease accessory protein UreE [Glutamicibacter]|uniref:Urease accessory protein UreE n=1 Tax=Glutamicibacter halophytocola TaxID=1933880 RepID=A0AA94XU28_9MICC|nr:MULTISPECIES: urease accessory protein UreE [Glutamicibacter]MBF6673428.1 urease accessory protein UreE [Glutamicibacter sp. FBE19]NQD42469.1 urease accessory protein UreE [Glutamicibacter halophytocola]UUX57518.1 urease accessory protein UreE [Glutamicibacter halophytocola]